METIRQSRARFEINEHFVTYELIKDTAVSFEYLASYVGVPVGEFLYKVSVWARDQGHLDPWHRFTAVEREAYNAYEDATR